jgi:amino acid permease
MMMGILAATTVGAGVFALPWVFHNAGWMRATGWLVALATLVIFAGYSYWRTLDAVGERQRLVGLARTHLGREWGALTLVGVLGGMIFALVIYLVLAQRFVAILLPLRPVAALILFWALAVLPATFSIRRFAILENIGTLLKCLLIVFIFLSATNYSAMFASDTSIVPNFLFPFGAILFALSGWNAIEPMYEFWKNKRGGVGGSAGGGRVSPLGAIAGGTFAIAALYFLFSAGILGSMTNGSFLSPDTLSGLIGWPFWKIATLAALGLLALWTAYGINAREIENALHKDLRWNHIAAFATVALLPLIIVFVGFSNIIQAVTFAGAIFAGLQYMAIFALSEKVLKPRPVTKWLMRLAGLVFALAALYEVYIFVVG